MYLVITGWGQDGRGVKFIEFASQNDANAWLNENSANYPDAFVQQSPGPWSDDWRIVGGALTVDPIVPVITSEMVKAEAYRRIVAILPEWKQRNLTARAVELSMKVAGGSSLTIDEQAEWDAGSALWQRIKVIRAKSDEIEGMNPIPADYTNDSYWSS